MLEDYLGFYLSPKTAQNQRAILERFIAKLASARLPLAEVSLPFVEQHLIDEARGKSWSGSTLRSAQITLRAFLRRAYHLGLLSEDFTEQMRITRAPVRTLQRFYSVEESQRILAAAQEAGGDAERAIHLALLSGLRRGDILRAHSRHLRQDGGRTLLHLPYRKGGMASTIALPAPTVAILPTAGPFITCSVYLLYQQMERVGYAAGLDHKLRPHALRSTFITHALDAGQSERDVMLAAGHIRLSTTAYYDQGYKAARVGVGDAVARLVAGESGGEA